MQLRSKHNISLHNPIAIPTENLCTGTTRQPPRPSRPLLQKRPHSKPGGGPEQATRRPQAGQASYQEDRQHGSSHHHHHHHQGFKDKVSSGHNSLLVRLPSKRPQHHRPRPYPEHDDAKTEEQAQDLSVQESVHRPSINSVDDYVRTV